jgi:hypothetical protein
MVDVHNTFLGNVPEDIGASISATGRVSIEVLWKLIMTWSEERENIRMKILTPSAIVYNICSGSFIVLI